MVDLGETPLHPYAGRLRDLDARELELRGVTEAFDETSNGRVLVAHERKGREGSLAPLKSIEHAHLAKVIDVIEQPDSWLVLTQVPRGVTLRSRLEQIGRKHAVDAVRTALRLADALSHLHDAGLSHGRVNPDNLLLALEEGTEPSLVFGAPSPVEYHRPERDPECREFDPRDDTWAATALLYFMLCGTPPPREGLENFSSLETCGIDDSLLCEVLLHGLARDEEQRAKTLTALKRELARWFIKHAADEPMPVGNASHKPPPLPPSVAPKPRRSVRSQSPHPSKSKVSSRRAWVRSVPLAIVAAIAGIGVAWGVSKMSKPQASSVVIKEKAVAASANPTAAPIDLAEVPVTGKEQSATDATTSCAKSYLREGTLSKAAQLDAICRETELPRALGTLRLAFASTTGAAPATAARFDTLGWYSLPLLSALRQACCTDPPAVKLPDLGGACPEFLPALEALAHIAATTQQFDHAIEKYTEATRCAVRTGRAPGISNAAPSPVAEKAFRELFPAAAAPAP